MVDNKKHKIRISEALEKMDPREMSLEELDRYARLLHSLAMLPDVDYRSGPSVEYTCALDSELTRGDVHV